MRKVSLIVASILFSAFAFSIPTSATSATQAAATITSITASCTSQGNADGALTVSGAMTGQTVTLVLTAHKPGESTFTTTTATTTIAFVDGQSSYPYSLLIPPMYRDSSVYNTLRIEVASPTLIDGSTTKSVSFSCSATTVTATPTPVITATPTPVAVVTVTVTPTPRPTTGASVTPSASPAASLSVGTVAGSQTTPNQQTSAAIGAGTTPATQSQIAPTSNSAGTSTTTNVAGVQSLPSTSTSSAPIIPATALGLGLILLGGVILRRAYDNN